jgi:hypothetical protein
MSGNFYLEPDTGKAVVMTGPELMRSTTILAEFSRNCAKVAFYSITLSARACSVGGTVRPNALAVLG